MNHNEYNVAPSQVLSIQAPDGADIYVELFRPTTGANGVEPTPPYPVILVMTPYEGSQPFRSPQMSGILNWCNRFVPKGYAFAVGHVYGTGNSEGCIDLTGRKEVAATSAVIEHLARASWSSGSVGMIGASYDGGVALHAAALGSEAAREALDAVIAFDGTTSLYETVGHDGVPLIPGYASALTGSYAAVAQPPAFLSPPSQAQVDPIGTVTRQVGACRASNAKAAADFDSTGDFSPWFDERSVRPAARAVEAATLMFEGFHDGPGIGTFGPIGFFDRIPRTTPHKLVLGQWGHGLSAGTYLAGGQGERAQAWFDRYLLGRSTAADTWSEVSIQDSSGAWREEETWPETGGPVGQLALSDGTLGTTAPDGSTAYLELGPGDVSGTSDIGRATFSTGRLPGPLHLAGNPVLDLWVKLDRPDGHIAVDVHAFAPDGQQITSNGVPDVAASGKTPANAFRSVQHLDPIRNGEFRQMRGEPAPVQVPLHVPVRFQAPVDLVVPQGGWITIEVAGMTSPMNGATGPSGSPTWIEILHDCKHPSALRFLMPEEEPTWLESLTSTNSPQVFPVEVEPGLRDGGGLASAKVCGKKPVDPVKVLEHP